MMLSRFKGGSRRSVEAAFEEARMLGHDSLGDEDLLQGILRSGEGIGAEALASLSVTLKAAQEESEGMLSDTLSSIGISLDEMRREAGDAFEMSLPVQAGRSELDYRPERRRRRWATWSST
jgi:ATP-dependent Clp protease ATP-binding subunit ClpA